MTIGFNTGIQHDAMQDALQNNGDFSASFIKELKLNTATDMWQTCRITGTRANMMTLDTVGYNDPVLAQRLTKRKKQQPTESYWYAFIRFYHDAGFKGAAIVVNSHSSYINGKTDVQIAQKDVAGLLIFLRENGIIIDSIELENESYFYPAITGMTGGSPSLMERLKYGRNIEKTIYGNCLQWQQHLKNIASIVRDYTDAPIGVSVDISQTMRSRNYNNAVLADRYYDFIAPHIYVTDASQSGVIEAVRRAVTQFPNDIEKRVTEFNWNYQERPNGHSLGNFQMLNHFKTAFAAYGIDHAYFHTLWNGIDANGWCKDLKPKQ
jgi:hypothetical protein